MRKSSLSFGDFIPISLLSYFYKLMVNVLATRLAWVMRNTISLGKSTFVKRRQLVDGVVILIEILDLDRMSKSECFIF